jgi:hypothetical protein
MGTDYASFQSPILFNGAIRRLSSVMGAELGCEAKVKGVADFLFTVQFEMPDVPGKVIQDAEERGRVGEVRNDPDVVQSRKTSQLLHCESRLEREICGMDDGQIPQMREREITDRRERRKREAIRPNLKPANVSDEVWGAM